MSLIRDLQWRYATKKMNGNKISPEKIDDILEAIQLAPSSFGLQPYTIYVIEDDEIKEKLLPASNNQTQVVECSHLLVFASWVTVTPEKVNTFIHDVATKRRVPIETLDDFKKYILSAESHMTEDQKAIWNSKQAYIALGIALAAAAEARVDATPMEGFNAAQYNEILGLTERGLTASIILPLGYRHEQDWLAPMSKVRRDKDLLYKFI